MLAKSTEDQKRHLEGEVATLKMFRDYPIVMDAYYQILLENVEMEAELEVLQARNAFINEQKAILSEAAKKEAEFRVKLEKVLLARMIEGVKRELQKPEMQQAYFEQCIQRLMEIPKEKFVLN